MNRIGKTVDFISKSKGVVKFIYLVLSALIFALPFICEKLWFCAWLGLSLLFVVVFDNNKPLKRVFGSLFCFFFAFYVFAYSWFVSLFPLDFAGLSDIESMGVILVAETLIPLIHSCLMVPFVFLGVVCARNVKNNYLRACLVSFGYVLGEFAQSLGPLAFPWAMLFVGQSERIEILQSASIFGSRFITFIIVFVNVLIAKSFLNVKSNRRKSKRYVCAALAVFMLNFGFGIVRVGTADFSDEKTLTAAAFQGNISSVEKWSETSLPATMIYEELAEKLRDECETNGKKIDVAVLPETAFASSVNPANPTGASYRTSSEIAQKLYCSLFVGAFRNDEEKSYNSIFVFDENGVCSDEAYDKVNLVPFGEFLPYRQLFTALTPFLTEINMLSDDLTKGKAEYPLKSRVGKGVSLVCFDSIFPENSRIQAKNGADFIVVSTNDSWYKESAALRQHASHSVMRAIENGLPVIRSANTGISLICDPVGRILSRSGVNERTYVVADIPINRNTTVYTAVGDILVPLSFVVLLSVLIYCFVKNKILPH